MRDIFTDSFLKNFKPFILIYEKTNEVEQYDTNTCKKKKRSKRLQRIHGIYKNTHQTPKKATQSKKTKGSTSKAKKVVPAHKRRRQSVQSFHTATGRHVHAVWKSVKSNQRTPHKKGKKVRKVGRK